MPIEQTSERITLKHPSGASAEILLYGASVVSWKSGTKSDSTVSERLFVSSKSALDGSKPVRGGIPVVFPCFGPPSHPEHAKLSQHGFARSTIWKYDGQVMDNEAGVSVKLTLEPTEAIKAVYAKPFHLSYVVTLAGHQLSTDIHVENLSSTDNLEFQALLHNYLAAPADLVLISPLKSLSYVDKTDNAQVKQETRDGVDVREFTDFVYKSAPGIYKVVWPTGGFEVKTKNFKDVVVWNPRETGASIGDMEDNGWLKYVCVEPGYVDGFAKLEPGAKWIGQQVLSVIDPATPSDV